MELISQVLYFIIEISSLIIEIWGILLIVISVLKEIYKSVFKYKFDTKEISTDSSLNYGLASALEILLAAEILQTLIAENFQSLLQVGLLVILRVFMAIIIHWELKNKGLGTIEDSESSN